MKRRDFLIITTAAAISVAVPLIYNWHNKKKITNPWISPLALIEIFDEKLIKEIGKEYRIKIQEENSKEKLMGLLKTDEIKSTDVDEICRLLEERSRLDFRNGKIKVIKGWIFSETELRQCALFSLT